LAESLTYSQLRETLPGLLQEALPSATAGTLLLSREKGQAFYPFSSFGYPQGFGEARFDPNQGLLEQVLRGNQPELLQAAQIRARMTNTASPATIFLSALLGPSTNPQSLALVPVQVDRQVRGLMVALSEWPQPLTGEHLSGLSTLASHLGILLEHLELTEKSQEFARQQEVLRSIGHAAASANDLEEVYTALHEGAQKLMPVDSFVVALFGEESPRATLAYVADQGQRSPPITVEANSGLIGQMRKQREPFLVDDLEAVEAFRPRFYGGVEQVRSAVLAPLHLGDRLIGSLSAQSLKPRAYRPEDLQLLTALAESAAVLIEHIRHLQLERLRARQFEGLAQDLLHLLMQGPIPATDSGRRLLLQQMTRMLREYLQAEFALTLSDDQEGRQFEIAALATTEETPVQVPPGGRIPFEKVPVLAEVARRGPSTVLPPEQYPDLALSFGLAPALAEAVGQIVALPIVSPSRVWGLFVFGESRTQQTRETSWDQLHLVEMILRQIALTLDQQQDAQTASQRLGALTRLYELELSLSATSDPARVLELTLDVAIEALWANGGGIALWDETAKTLRPVIDRNVAASIAEAPFRPDGMAMTTFRSGRARYFRDLQLEPGVHPVVAQSGIRACAHLPLRTDGPPFGLLILDFLHPRDFPEEDQRLLEMFSARAALAYEKARLLGAIEEAHARFERTVQRVPGAIYRGEINKGVIFVSQGIRGIAGFSPEEWVENPQLWQQRLHPEDHERVRTSFEAAFAQGKDWSEEYRLLDREGKPRWIRDVARLAHEPDGSVRYYDGVMTDITARRQLEERLLSSARLESATALGMGLAHEINNALSTLSLHSYLLSRRTAPDNPDVTHHLQVIEQTVQHTADLIAHFRELAQPAGSQLGPVAIPALVEGTLAQFAEDLRRQGIQVDLSLDPDLPRVRGDQAGLAEAFSAILRNAVEAMPSGGVLKVGAGRSPLRREGSEVSAIQVEIADTGPGIPAEDLSRLFEPGFTTKVEGGTVRGLGFGLAIAQQIIMAHGGEIEVQSQIGQGTTLKVILPTESAA
jgi:PAS domain S-box-containing protein